MFATTVSVLLAVGPVAPPPKTIVPPMFYSEIVKAAKVIATGTVTKSVCRYERGKETIATLVTFEHLTLHKGKAGPSMTLRLAGGTIGDDHLVVPLMPKFQVGKRYLVYVDDLEAKGAKVSPIVGFYQGAFEITVKNGTETLISMLGDELIGIEKNRFVFAGKAPKPEANPAPKAVKADVGFKPADPDVEAKELAKRAKEAAERRAHRKPLPLVEVGTGTAGPAPSESKSPVTPIRTRPNAQPIVVAAKNDTGARMSARSLLAVRVEVK